MNDLKRKYSDNLNDEKFKTDYTRLVRDYLYNSSDATGFSIMSSAIVDPSKRKALFSMNKWELGKTLKIAEKELAALQEAYKMSSRIAPSPSAGPAQQSEFTKQVMPENLPTHIQSLTRVLNSGTFTDILRASKAVNEGLGTLNGRYEIMQNTAIDDSSRRDMIELKKSLETMKSTCEAKSSRFGSNDSGSTVIELAQKAIEQIEMFTKAPTQGLVQPTDRTDSTYESGNSLKM